MLIAGVVLDVHPLVFAFYVMARVGENVVNHCGLDNFFINLLTLKVGIPSSLSLFGGISSAMSVFAGPIQA